MKFKSILKEFNECVKNNPLTDCVLYLRNGSEEIAIIKTEDKYEAWGMDFSETALAGYIYCDEDEEYEVLNNVPEKELLKHIPLIIKIKEYYIDIDD